MSYDLNKWVANERRSIKRKRYLPYALGAMMAAVAGMAAFELFDGGSDISSGANFGPTLILLVVAMSHSPFARDSWLGLGAGPHDEFESAILARAAARAFAVLMGLLVLLFGWLWLASLSGWPVPRTPADWSALGLAILGIGAALPILLAEIMVPFPPQGDPEEEGL